MLKLLSALLGQLEPGAFKVCVTHLTILETCSGAVPQLHEQCLRYRSVCLVKAARILLLVSCTLAALSEFG